MPQIRGLMRSNSRSHNRTISQNDTQDTVLSPATINALSTGTILYKKTLGKLKRKSPSPRHFAIDFDARLIFYDSDTKSADETCIPFHRIEDVILEKQSDTSSTSSSSSESAQERPGTGLILQYLQPNGATRKIHLSSPSSSVMNMWHQALAWIRSGDALFDKTEASLPSADWRGRVWDNCLVSDIVKQGAVAACSGLENSRQAINVGTLIKELARLNIRPSISTLQMSNSTVTRSQFNNITMSILKESGVWEMAEKLKGEFGMEDTADAFHYLHSAPFRLFQPTSDDMQHSLASYYIWSSHNTYLKGNQLSGESSIDCYRDALRRGCRCVELDCWDGPDGQPVIYHGRTLTSKVPFKGVVEEIKKSAFVTSPYPVILSLETHCSPRQQELMASILKGILGNILVTEKIDGDENQLPSPERLKGRILIKAKADPSPVTSPAATSPSAAANTSPGGTSRGNSRSNSFSNKGAPGGLRTGEESEDSDDRPSPTMSTALTSLAVYCVGKKLDFSEAHISHFISSISEGKLESISRDAAQSAGLQALNASRLTRVYPKGLRVDSSNYNPQLGWRLGCQIVALNLQTKDLGYQLNEAMFERNHSLGYVLKPDFSKPPAYKLRIQLLCAERLPGAANTGDIVDPFVVVEHHAPLGGCLRKKSATVSNNGYSPVWNETFEFDVTECCSFIRLTVWDKDTGRDDLIGWYTCHCDVVGEGYRWTGLKDPYGYFYPGARIFLKVSKLPLSSTPGKVGRSG